MMDEVVVRFPLDRDLARTRPQAAKYAQKYGKWNLMSEEWPSCDFYALGYKNSEEVYSACLKQGVTWQKLLNYQPDDGKDVTL